MARTGNGHMVQEYYIERVREIRRTRKARLEGLKNRRQALAYQRDVRNAIQQAVGPNPPKTALRASITGVIERRGFRIEKISYESRPGCLVTANLYVPDSAMDHGPAVVGSCGHDAKGKQADIYQAFCQRLVRSGFVTMIIDPFNQGERDQYFRLKDREIVASCTHAHNMMGKQLQLMGDWFGAWRNWDAIRALDYLQTRPEVDPYRIGITGNSGGGTETAWTWGAEDRFAFAAPSCFVTTFLHNLENEIPADAEQYPPGVIGHGLEMVDFLIAQAPKPAMILGQNFCFFDRRGVKEAYEDLRSFYRVLGAPRRNVDWFIGPEGHGFSAHNQKAMLRFFCAHNRLKPSAAAPRPFPTQDLNVTPHGEVVEAGATPIYELSGQRAQGLRSKRKRLKGPALTNALKRVLTLPKRSGTPHFRTLRGATESRSRVARYAIETEPGIRAILRKVMDTPHTHTLDVEREVTLYLPHLASEDELTSDRHARSLTRSTGLYGLDPRGLGETRPDDNRDFFHAYGVDYMHDGYAMMLGESFIGRRTHDVLRAMDLLAAEGARKIHLIGRGQGAILALFAGVLHSHAGRVTLKNGPISYHEWTQTPLVHWPFASIPRGILKRFDLPDCVRALGKRVSLIQPWRPDMRPYTRAQLKSALKEARLSTTLLST